MRKQGRRNVRADEIKDRESFKVWLNARPGPTLRSEAVTLAHRAAMRVAVYLQPQGKLDLIRHSAVLTYAFRCHANSRVAATYPSREIDFSALDASAAAADLVVFASAAFASAASAADASAAFAIPLDSDSAFAAESASTAVLYAANASAAADVWEKIRIDASALESGVAVSEVMATPLWRSPPAWWEEERSAFRQMLFDLDQPNHGFAIWAEWYDDAAFGKPVFGIKSKDIRTTLERNIALGSTDGTFNKAFWTRDSPEINADIARWVEEARQEDRELFESATVVLSYHAQELESANEVSGVISTLGYASRPYGELSDWGIRRGKRLFVFPSRSVVLISDTYFADSTKQNEWDDINKRYREINPHCLVPVLIRPVALPAGVRVLGPIPLYDRSAEEAREDLRRALSFDAFFMSAQQARQAAKSVATHQAVLTEDGKWNTQRLSDDLKPFIDSDILKLPQLLQKQAEILIRSLAHERSNAPPFVVDYLKESAAELGSKGAAFDASIVKTWVNQFELEVEACADEAWVSRHRRAIDQLLSLHAVLLQHYPAILRREYLALQSQIDTSIFDHPDFADRLADLRDATHAAHKNGVVTENFLNEVNHTFKTLNALAVFGRYAPGSGDRLLSKTGELPLHVLRKKEAFEKGGTMDRIGTDMTEIAKSAAGEVGGALVMEALKGIAKLIFGA